MYNYVCDREYDKLLKATARRKLALRQQKAIIKSYLKSVQLRGRSFEEVNEFKLFFMTRLSISLQHTGTLLLLWLHGNSLEFYVFKLNT
jgi:hypothetical protein